ncbi:hypothetical protein EMIHUDRAFT_201601 [Emiliania huxleyi CCMP1516]|uniref:Uncharacterized protein n=2 Tax=Emiliania huxleyi TaxID=2903 RepID=A0A0D3KI96_EMIH1|nr:hypothetical protein EMIHUDRAFT_201601 [Emiliania huxleyi CCMP1516]EOD35481.1 hypothetical protein EMIHUDRAFT_201601 [Emiliania huxleyi CCMP1516]|eukprot:XP_005787910.1 hypothetical protein EMIHUDRAFT_201601 [Emiliania huxleyi CCMP1516]
MKRKQRGSRPPRSNKPSSATLVHVLYLETAEDQRGSDGLRSPGVHLNERGRGPALCAACGGVADAWRGRLDNMQTALRMCCSEGALFRPSVAQFALVSPRAVIRYSLAEFGGWLSERGTKRATEAVVIGAALRAASGELPAASGVSHAPLEHTTAAGALAASLRGCGVSDLLLCVGGPSGVPRRWQERLAAALGGERGEPAPPLLGVSLRGGVQHSAPALAELLLLHERGRLLPLVQDRLALSDEQHKAWRRAEREIVHAWLRALGLHADGNTADGGGAALPAAAEVARLLEAHRALLQRLEAAGSLRAGANEVGAGSEEGTEEAGEGPGGRQGSARGALPHKPEAARAIRKKKRRATQGN